MEQRNAVINQLQAENTQMREQIAKLHKQISSLRKQSVLVPILREKLSNLTKDLEYHESLWDESVLKRGGNPVYMHGQETLNAAMKNPKKAQFATHMSADQLEYAYRKVENAVRADGSKMFYENGDPKPGNRTKLTVRQSVFVSVAYKAGGIRQTDFEMMFGVSQPTISRCLAYIDPLLNAKLPTAKKVQEAVKNASDEELEELIPGNVIIPDGTETPIQRPTDNETQKEFYSGKKKRHTVKNTIIINKNQVIVYVGPTHPGKIHDMKMLREDDPDLGQITELAKAEDTPEDKRPKCLSDLGYKKIDGFYPGADHKQPHKKEKNGKLTKRQKQDNKSVGRRRVPVEHAIGKLKRYRILGRPFDGTIKQFDLTLSILTGLANLKTLWNRKKKKPKREF